MDNSKSVEDKYFEGKSTDKALPASQGQREGLFQIIFFDKSQNYQTSKYRRPNFYRN